MIVENVAENVTISPHYDAYVEAMTEILISCQADATPPMQWMGVSSNDSDDKHLEQMLLEHVELGVQVCSGIRIRTYVRFGLIGLDVFLCIGLHHNLVGCTAISRYQVQCDTNVDATHS